MCRGGRDIPATCLCGAVAKLRDSVATQGLADWTAVVVEAAAGRISEVRDNDGATV